MVKKFGFQPGNQLHLAIKDPEERKKAYRDFCKHISEGYPIEAWSYRNGENKCHWQTMLSYLTKFKDEFESFLKEEAHCLSYKKWFEKGMKLSDGKVKGNPSPQTWATIMRNMFHWDYDAKSKDAVNAEKFDTLLEFFSKAFPDQKQSSEKEQGSSIDPDE